MAQPSQFYLTLPSNTKVEGNTTSDFRVELPSAIELEGQWEVGLAEILYPGSYDTIHDCSMVMNINDREGAAASGFSTSIRYLKVKIDDGHYATIQELLEAINFAMMRAWKEREPMNGAVHVKKFDDAARFEYTDVIKKVRLTINEADNVSSLELDKRLHHTLGFEYGDLTRSQIAKYPVDLKAGLESLFVYCNLISPQWVGDVRTNLLKILPLRGSPGDTISIDCPTVHFVDLLTNRFSTIEINIKASDGSDISWAYGKIFVKLAFRKKKIR